MNAKPREEIIYGFHAVSAALSNDPANVLLIWAEQGRHDKRMLELLQQAEAQGIAVERLRRAELERRCEGTKNQGIAARYRSAAPGTEHDLKTLLEKDELLLLVLDSVQDPHNLGACLRTAEAAGVDGVIVPKDRAVGLTPTVRKVASGAAERIPFFQVTNLARSLKEWQQQGVWVVGAAGEAENSLYDTDLKGKLALVMGAEGKGLRRLTRETCDLLVYIPMQGQTESLNVSVATGICLFEAVRQRHVDRAVRSAG